jgi:hypothetical protein
MISLEKSSRKNFVSLFRQTTWNVVENQNIFLPVLLN